MYDIVVAKYKENLDWIPSLFSANRANVNKIYVYDKFGQHSVCLPNDIPIVTQQLPNIGREAHTFLHHICTRWDVLADFTLFLQGNPYDHISELYDYLAMELPKPNKAEPFYPKNYFTEHHHHDMLSSPYQLPVVLKINKYFDSNQASYKVTFPSGAQYIVPRNVLHKRTKPFFQNLLYEMESLETQTQTSLDYLYTYNNPMSTLDAWTMERLWPYIFGD